MSTVLTRSIGDADRVRGCRNEPKDFALETRARIGMTAMQRSYILGSGVLAIAGLVTIALPVVTARPAANAGLIALEVLVGLAFVGAAAAAPADLRVRGSAAAVGVAWAAASAVPSAALVHQAGLVLLLSTFPTGRVQGGRRLLLFVLAVPVAVGLVPQPVVAAVFAVTAVVAWDRVRERRPGAWYPVLAAGGIAAVLAMISIASRALAATYDPVLALIAYELVVLGVAITLPFAVHAVRAARGRLADRLLGTEGPAGLVGLATVLGQSLGDQSVAVHRWDEARATFVDALGVRTPPPGPGRRRIEIEDGERVVAVVDSAASAIDDPLTAAAVADAVRLTVQNLRRQAELDRRLDELEAARARVVVAADRQRAITAERLRGDVLTPIASAASTAHTVIARVTDRDASSALAVVVQELSAAADDVTTLVAGIPPAELGGGRLGQAIRELVRRSPVPVDVSESPAAMADAATETALFYVCSEALANAVKHAAAHRIGIVIEADDDTVSVSISDDGRGGADANGSGLQGLADRLAGRGGWLRVDSPPGAGTIVTAGVPR